MEDNWFGVKEACSILNISRRTLYDWINDEKIQNKKVGKNRLVWIDDQVDTGSSKSTDRTNLHSNIQTDAQTLELLKEQLEHFKKQNETLQVQLAEQAIQYTEASRRHDTIVMQMQSTIEKQQLQLESSQSVSFFRRLFGVFQS